MDITIPQTYEELSEQQRGVLCSILLTSSPFGGGGGRLPVRIIQILLSHLPKRTQQQLLLQLPFTALWQYAEPFLTTEKLYHFREVNLTIKQFSVADSLYYRLRLSQYQDELLLRQLMASLYNLPDTPFDVLNLPQVAEHTDKTPITTAYEVAFAYTCCREYIIGKYPKVFSSPSSTQRGEKPVFRKEATYTPFSKIISVMAMDKHQPLGNWHQCNATRVYDFFEVLTESILQAEQRAKS